METLHYIGDHICDETVYRLVSNFNLRPNAHVTYGSIDFTTPKRRSTVAIDALVHVFGAGYVGKPVMIGPTIARVTVKVLSLTVDQLDMKFKLLLDYLNQQQVLDKLES